MRTAVSEFRQERRVALDALDALKARRAANDARIEALREVVGF
jgi:hypothetical protein